MIADVNFRLVLLMICVPRITAVLWAHQLRECAYKFISMCVRSVVGDFFNPFAHCIIYMSRFFNLTNKFSLLHLLTRIRILLKIWLLIKDNGQENLSKRRRIKPHSKKGLSGRNIWLRDSVRFSYLLKNTCVVALW